MTRLPRVVVSVGCPSGIGPEVSVVAAVACAAARVTLVGDLDMLRRAAALRGVDWARFVAIESPAEIDALPDGCVGVLSPRVAARLRRTDLRPGHPSAAGGAAQLAWIDAACDAVSSGAADAMVTGPVSKEVIARGASPEARRFLGHTEHLQRRLGADEVVMAFHSERLTTSLVTTHLPLARVPRAITPDAVASATFWLARLLSATAEKASPRPVRVAVASLNPHAGEGGLLGREESAAILPGIALARSRAASAKVACSIVGPVPAETAFRLAATEGGSFDGVVAMYHDQATIPMKLLGFGDAVNVSLGLPIVRTSVDHGTAYDIAGRGIADARGMMAALDLAARLAVSATGGERGRRPRTPPRTGRAPRRSA